MKNFPKEPLLSTECEQQVEVKLNSVRKVGHSVTVDKISSMTPKAQLFFGEPVGQPADQVGGLSNFFSPTPRSSILFSGSTQPNRQTDRQRGKKRKPMSFRMCSASRRAGAARCALWP